MSTCSKPQRTQIQPSPCSAHQAASERTHGVPQLSKHPAGMQKAGLLCLHTLPVYTPEVLQAPSGACRRAGAIFCPKGAGRALHKAHTSLKAKHSSCPLPNRSGVGGGSGGFLRHLLKSSMGQSLASATDISLGSGSPGALDVWLWDLAHGSRTLGNSPFTACHSIIFSIYSPVSCHKLLSDVAYILLIT